MADTGATTLPAAVLERRGPVALLTLNRPDAMNAVNAALARAAGDALAEFAAARAVAPSAGMDDAERERGVLAGTRADRPRLPPPAAAGLHALGGIR